MAETAATPHVKENTLGELNDILFEQLRRLQAVDATNEDALKAEISRSKAVESLSEAVVESASLVLDATRMRANYTKQTVSMPKMLMG